MPSVKDLVATAAALVLAIGGAGVLIVGISSWLAKLIADRILERERARTARDTETLKHSLLEQAQQRHDSLSRKRNVYASLATSMRVFLGSSRIATAEQIATFYKSYDESCLWASEPVIESAGALLDAIVSNTKRPGTVPQDQLVALYQRCMLAMRRDAGFPDSDFTYRVVSF